MQTCAWLSTYTMASSCSISNRCGLMARRPSRSHTTLLVSTASGSMINSGGMSSPFLLSDNLDDLAQLGEQNVRPTARLLQLFRRRLQRHLVAGKQGRPHAQPAGGDHVLGDPRTDVQHLLRL